jgi:hypothetical protein
MNKDDFTGESSITTPPGCQLSFYTEADGGAVSDLDKSHAATDAWYGGNTYYDYTNGKYKDDATGSQLKLAKAFTRMLWRSTQTVAFGIKGKHVAAWYCNPSGRTNSNAAGVTGAAERAATFKANVMNSCLKLHQAAGAL